MWVPGDFIVTHGDALVSKLIRFGQRLRIHGDDVRFTWANHAALVVSPDGDLIEALGRGVTRSPASKYWPRELHLIRTGASEADRDEAVAFAEWCLANRQRYGWATIASIAVTLLVGGKLTFAVDGTEICSGLVARAQERTGVVFSRDPSHIMPAELAKYYGVG